MLCLSIALAGCAGSLPPSDWCYRFDFRASNFGILLSEGDYVPNLGFVTDESTGRLNLTYDLAATVMPTAFAAQLRRAKGPVLAPMEVEGSANVFGISNDTVRTIVPSGVETTTVSMVDPTGSESGDHFQLKGAILGALNGTRVALQWLDVMGDDTNPFPQNNCGDFVDSTPTPGLDIGVPLGDSFGELPGAQATLSAVGDSLAAPGGVGLLPNTDPAALFGYIKWVTNPTTADQLMGPFAPVLWQVGIFIQADVILGGLYMVVWVVAFIVGWLIGFFRLAVTVLEAITLTPVALAVIAVAAMVLALVVILGNLAVIVQAVAHFLGIG